MPSKFNAYKRQVRYHLLNTHNWTGRRITAYVSNNQLALRDFFDEGKLPSQAALIIAESRRVEK